MSYYYSKTVQGSFDETIEKITDNLKKEGFGIITQIDVTKTMKDKLNVDFKKYRILGACNPPFAYKALQAEDKIGILLPCNVVVQEKNPGEIEVACVNPMVSMQNVSNIALESVAKEIQDKLHRAVDLV
jgi:uncharacterized protein (DUF302 family)